MIYIKKKKAQSVVEMGFFAGVIILVFSMLFSYTESLNYVQMGTMEAFRRGLHYANNNNSQVSYQLNRHRRAANFQEGFGQGSASEFGGAAQIYWAVPFVGESANSELIYKIDNVEELGPSLLPSVYGNAVRLSKDNEANLNDLQKQETDGDLTVNDKNYVKNYTDVWFEGEFGMNLPLMGGTYYLDIQEGIYDKEHQFYVYKKQTGGEEAPIIKKTREW